MRRATRVAARAASALPARTRAPCAGQARAFAAADKAGGVLSEFAKSVKSGLESNPELKKSLDELKKSTSSLAEKAREGVAATAGAARDNLGAGARSATAAVRDSVGDTPAELLKAAKERVGGSAEWLKQQSAALGSVAREAVGGAAGPQAAPGGADSGAPGADAGAGASERAQSAPPPPPKEGASGVMSRLRGWAAAAASTVTDAVRAEVRLAMMDEGDAAAERARERAAARPGPAPGPINTAANAVAVAKPRVSAWQRRWGALRDVAAASPLSPIFSRLGAATSSAAAAAAAASEPVVQRGRDAAADLRERWETSDSPLVHRIQDATDAVFVEESPAARTLAAIRAAQPDFDMHELVALVRRDIPPILKAYLSADVAALRSAGIAPELLERLSAMMATWRADGQVMDNTILDLSELEVLETKMVGDHPMVVFQFQIQQINCIRDAKGIVVDGAADDIQSVYYAWAVEQLPATVTAPATWRLRDMMVRGFHAIV